MYVVEEYQMGVLPQALTCKEQGNLATFVVQSNAISNRHPPIRNSRCNSRDDEASICINIIAHG